MAEARAYMGVPLTRHKVGVFDFTSCEGCQLQLINNEGSLLDFLSHVEIVKFREAMTGGTDDYAVAIVEGSITRADEVERVKAIRGKAAVLVALGSCACFGGVNQLKNRFRDMDWVKKTVYGSHPIDTDEARPVSAVVPVDLSIPGCPVKKEEVESIILNIALGKSVELPRYPVCMECKANENICLFDLGQPCLGPVTRAGCDAWCPGSRMGCWGCRGPADDCNMPLMDSIMKERGFTAEAFLDRLECFGGFAEFVEQVRAKADAEKKGGAA